MKRPVHLSGLVVTKNEESAIERCLRSLSFCDEVVVIDSESTDETVTLARAFPNVQVYVEPWRGFGPQKQFGLELCRGRWVLSLDADEVVTETLRGEIEEAVREEAHSGYELPRRVRYLGSWIDHGGWGRDWVLRLFRRDGARFTDDLVHERVVVGGKTARLGGILEHHTYRDLAHHWEKAENLARLSADQAFRRGRRARLWDLWLRPPARGLKIYVWKRGFLDGWRGIVVAGMGSAYVFLKYAKLREKEEVK